jgi:hypothetical protein
LPVIGGKITPPGMLDELRELLDITEQCAAGALRAQREAARYLDHFRVQAEDLKEQAARARSPELRERLLRIAASHERLVKLAESLKTSREAYDTSDNPELPAGGARGARDAARSLRRPSDEDSVAMARRHIAEAEDRIARQENLVAKLSSDRRHTALAAEAREILATLKHTLVLARQHLEIELKK